MKALGKAVLVAVLVVVSAACGSDDDGASVRDIGDGGTATGSPTGSPTGAGTGWVLDAREGLVVTNAHVVNLQPDAGTSSFAVTADGRSQPAEIVGVAPCEDLALLRVEDTEGLRSLPLGS